MKYILLVALSLSLAPATFTQTKKGTRKRKPVAVKPAAPAPQERVVKALRHLEAAVEVGVTYDEYTKRLTDAKIVVDEALAELPDGDFKKFAAASLAQYQSAARSWRFILDNPYPHLEGNYEKMRENSWGLARMLLDSALKSRPAK